MKNTLSILLILVALILAPQPMLAQTSLTSTTLSAAVNANATTLSVTSATGFTASSGTATYLMCVNYECMQIQGVSGTTITVIRGVQGSRAVGHVSGATVWVGSADRFSQAEPLGSCTASLTGFTPRYVIPTGLLYYCNSGGYWTRYDSMQTTAVKPRTAITTSYTALQTDEIVAVTSITNGATITVTLPCSTVPPGKEWVIKDESGNANSNRIILISPTPSGGSAYVTGFAARRIYSNGTDCFDR